MRRRASEDMPSYAAETVASAQLSGSHLAASGGLFLALLAVMGVMEAPIPPWTDSAVETPIRAAHDEPARVRAAGVPSACADTQIITRHPASETHARAG